MSEELRETEASINIDTNELPAKSDDEAPERFIVFEEALEAVLFAAGHPVSYATLARVFNMTPAKVRDKVFEYALKYNAKSELERGIILLTYSDNCQLCTKELYLPEIRDALGIRKSGSLSTAAMETLAVVAYNQPVTRIFVDTIRKVDSSYAMNSLIDRGLIECVGRLDVPGRPMQYGTTSDFLRCFGLSSIKELPPATEDLINMFEKVKDKENEEIGADTAQLSIDDIELLPETPIDAKDSNDAQIAATVGAAINTSAAVSSVEPDEPSAEDDVVDID